MKKCYFALILLSSFISCSKDDCTADGFLGTWRGTRICTGSTEMPANIIVTGSGESLVLNGDNFVDEAISRDDCSLKGGVSLFGIGNVISGNLSTDGSTLTIVSETSRGIILQSCKYVLTK